MVAVRQNVGKRVSKRILIVEDELVSRRALASLLSQVGYATVAVESAEQALRWLDGATAPEVALIDLDLPGMSGLELIRRLERFHSNIRPILITGAERDRVGRLRRLHAIRCAWLYKPVDFERLVRLIDGPARGG